MVSAILQRSCSKLGGKGEWLVLYCREAVLSCKGIVHPILQRNCSKLGKEGLGGTSIVLMNCSKLRHGG